MFLMLFPEPCSGNVWNNVLEYSGTIWHRIFRNDIPEKRYEMFILELFCNVPEFGKRCMKVPVYGGGEMERREFGIFFPYWKWKQIQDHLFIYERKPEFWWKLNLILWVLFVNQEVKAWIIKDFAHLIEILRILGNAREKWNDLNALDSWNIQVGTKKINLNKTNPSFKYNCL